MTLYQARWWQLYPERKDWVPNPQHILFFYPFLILWLCQSLLFFSYFCLIFNPLLFFNIWFKNRMWFYYTALTQPSSNFKIPYSFVCVWQSHIVRSHCPLLVGRWAETSHNPLAYPSLSSSCFHCLSFCLLCWAIIWQMLKTQNCLFWSCFSLSLCVLVHMNGLWPLCSVWSRIHLVHLQFVCLSQPSICCWGESWVWWSCYCWPAGCCCLFGS